jgi:ERCC4-type nuclease
MTILFDSHEQQPLIFSLYPDVQIQKETIKAGDYTLVGHDMPNDEDSIIIERKKDCQELVTNLVAQKDRFEKEMEILTTYKHKFIFVCAPDNFSFIYDRGFTKISPNYAYSRLADIYLKYGVSTVFFPSREATENYIYRLFKKIYTKHNA